MSSYFALFSYILYIHTRTYKTHRTRRRHARIDGKLLFVCLFQGALTHETYAQCKSSNTTTHTHLIMLVCAQPPPHQPPATPKRYSCRYAPEMFKVMKKVSLLGCNLAEEFGAICFQCSSARSYSHWPAASQLACALAHVLYVSLGWCIGVLLVLSVQHVGALLLYVSHSSVSERERVRHVCVCVCAFTHAPATASADKILMVKLSAKLCLTASPCPIARCTARDTVSVCSTLQLLQILLVWIKEPPDGHGSPP